MKSMQGLIAGSLLFVCLAQTAVADTSLHRTLIPDDLYRVQDISEPEVSPDGQWVAYVVTSSDRDADEARSAIWMVSWDGTGHVALTNPAAGTDKPRWSPDGRYLAFLRQSEESDGNQVMLLDRRGGEARALFTTAGEISDYQWSPDGKRLALSMEQNEEHEDPKPIVIDAWHFKQDGAGYLGVGRRLHLYLLDVASARVVPLTAGSDYNDDLPVWSPDGRSIAFVRSRERGFDRDGRMDIDVIEAREGADPRNLARPYAPNAQKLAWSGDGKLIAFLEGREPRINAYMLDRLFVAPAAGGPARALTDKLDRAVMSYAFTSDSAAVTIAVEDDCTVYPARIDVATGTITRIETAEPSVVSSITTAGDHTAMLHTSDHALAEVYALDGGRMRKLSAHNEALLSELSLGAVEQTRFKDRDGAEIHGLIVKPPGFVAGRRYPLLLWIHGGPNGQDQHSLVLDGYEFEPQMFAARGFVVLRVNYRGGSGRGLEFARAILADWGHKEVEDLLAGVDHVVALGIADPQRIAIGGWSYGGILTDYTIATDRRFKAAISGAGSANQLSTYGSDQYILQYTSELGAPWSSTPLWLKLSYPFFHADRIHTPTLFLGGDKDFNVPIIGGEQMYQALRTLDVPAQLVVYPGEHHVFTRPSFIKDLADREFAWIDRFMPSAAVRP